MACFVAGGARWLDTLFRSNEGGGRVKSSSDDSSCLLIEPITHDQEYLSYLAKRSKIGSPIPSVLSCSSEGRQILVSKVQGRRNRDIAGCQAYERRTELLSDQNRHVLVRISRLQIFQRRILLFKSRNVRQICLLRKFILSKLRNVGKIRLLRSPRLVILGLAYFPSYGTNDGSFKLIFLVMSIVT